MAAGAAAVVLPALAAAGARAQDTTAQGVAIGLRYAAGTRPGVFVLPVSGERGDSVRALLRRDLDYGDRVTVLGPDVGGPASVVNERGELAYPVFATLGAVAVVQATVTSVGVHVALHDVARQRVLQVRDFPVPAAADAGWRLAVHGVADEVERWITGVRGIAATRVSFVRGGRIWVVDADGEGAVALSDGGGALSPAWHPDGTHIAFSVFTSSGTQIAVRDVASGALRLVPATSGGLNITPVFSPAGDIIVWAHADEAGADLYATAAFESTPARRITVGRGSDNVSPTFSPDGRRIAFTSGRLGHPEVYVADADGTNPDLLTAYGAGDVGYRSNPDWSPDGRAIAFQARVGGRFQVMTITLRGRAVKQHTNDGSNEDPAWAPDSRHVVFSSTRTGSKQLFVLDTESGRVRQLTTGGAAARLPAWSPRLSGR